jgi:hypothetical protein
LAYGMLAARLRTSTWVMFTMVSDVPQIVVLGYEILLEG